MTATGYFHTICKLIAVYNFLASTLQITLQIKEVAVERQTSYRSYLVSRERTSLSDYLQHRLLDRAIMLDFVTLLDALHLPLVLVKLENFPCLCTRISGAKGKLYTNDKKQKKKNPWCCCPEANPHRYQFPTR